jgi:hypothetical protein
MRNIRKFEQEMERIRRESNALLTLIITPDWGYISTDPKLAPKDAIETLRNEIPSLAEFLTKKGSAR